MYIEEMQSSVLGLGAAHSESAAYPSRRPLRAPQDEVRSVAGFALLCAPAARTLRWVPDRRCAARSLSGTRTRESVFQRKS